MALSTGDKLGPYEITAPLGAGGMGEVYKARDTRLDRTVAVKVLPEEIAKREDLLARFEREARAVASLNHPNICSLFDIGPGYMVMELIDGETLADRIGKGALPLEQALKYAAQIADALDRAHRAGVTHRDVKPQNIMVTRDGVKILDFGLAKSADARPGPGKETLTRVLTTEGTVVGTPQYMAPELFEGREADARADIWAFGAVLYEMVTGRKAFEGKSYSSLVGAILATDPPPMAIAPFSPLWLERLVRRCLAKDPEERYFSMHDIVLDLRTPPEESVSSAQTPRSKLWMALAAALLLAAITFASLWLRSATPAARLAHFSLPGPMGVSVQVSPDGKWLMKPVDGVFCMRRLDNPTWRTINGTEGATMSSAFWSEDSTAIGFVSGGRLRMAAFDGSPARDLIEAPEFRGASWRGGSSDGTILLSASGKLRVVDVRSRSTRDLPLTFKPGSPPIDPAFLPEGDGFVFAQNLGNETRLYRSGPHSSTIDPLFLTSGRVRFAKHPSTGKWHVFYVAGERELLSSQILQTAPIDPRTGQFLAAPVKLLRGISRAPSIPPYSRFCVGDGGVLSWTYNASTLPIWRLVWTDRQGTLLARVTESDKYVSLALSPDESRIAVQVDDPDPHIRMLDSRTGVGARISNTPDPESYPHWSADGKSIFYVSGSAGVPEIRRHSVDNSTKPEVIWRADAPSTSGVVLSGVSPEGRYLLLIQARGSLGRIDLQAPFPRRLEPFAERKGEASLSPDGRSLVWHTSTEGLLVQPYASGSEAAKRFMGGPDLAGFVNTPFFSADGRTIYALFKRNLVAFSLAPDLSLGEPKVLRPWTTTPRSGATGGAASRDGRRLLLLETEEKDILDPQVITDWTALLPK